MSYQLKIKLKFIFYEILGLLIIALILFLAYLYNKLIETGIVMVLFFIYRRLFEKQYHASSLYLCGIISILVFVVIIQLEVGLSISILFSVVLTFTMTLISYYVKDYLDNIVLLKQYRKKLNEINTKCVENLTKEEMINLFPDIKYSTIEIVYDYLHRPQEMSADEFAYKHDLSASSIYKYVKLIRDKYKDLSNIDT